MAEDGRHSKESDSGSQRHALTRARIDSSSQCPLLIRLAFGHWGGSVSSSRRCKRQCPPSCSSVHPLGKSATEAMSSYTIAIHYSGMAQRGTDHAVAPPTQSIEERLQPFLSQHGLLCAIHGASLDLDMVAASQTIRVRRFGKHAVHGA